MVHYRHLLIMPCLPLLVVAITLANTDSAATARAETPTRAENWPHWRGPLENGSSSTADPPLTWSEEENVRWKVEIPGRGGSTPIVWGDRVFVLSALPVGPAAEPETESAATPAAAEEPRDATAEPAPQRGDRDGRGGRGDRGGRGGRGGRPRFGGFGGNARPTQMHQFLVIAYDRHSGEKIWQTVATEQVPHEPGHGTNTFASSSPVTDGQHLFVNFGSRGVYCLDLDGNLVWKRDLGQMQTRAQFGEAASPALHGNRLVVPWDHEGQSFLTALDTATGEPVWKVDRDERTTWATPLITEHEGQAQVITNGSIVRSYSLDSGELLWQCGGQVENPIPSPVRIDDQVICMTGYRGNAIYAIRLDARGDVADTDSVAWTRFDAAPYVASPALHDGRLYFTKSRDGIFSSVDAVTGESVISQQRLTAIRSIYASPVAAQDRVYVTGREGTTVVLRHGPEFEILATNQLDDGLDASPALVGDRIYLRGEKHLYCIGEPDEEASDESDRESE